MSRVDRNQPLGTPTWVVLEVPDTSAAKEFYGPVMGWDFADDSDGYSVALKGGKRVAGVSGGAEGPEFAWAVHLATDDIDATVRRVVDAGGKVVSGPEEFPDLGRTASVVDTVGAPFCLWQGTGFPGCELVNEPGALVRNDLSTADTRAARVFYAQVFDFDAEVNDEVPGMDHTFFRRPDGHEVAGVLGEPDAVKSRWSTAFEVEDAHTAAKAAVKAGGQIQATYEMSYGDIVILRDRDGAEFSVVSRPKDE